MPLICVWLTSDTELFRSGSRLGGDVTRSILGNAPGCNGLICRFGACFLPRRVEAVSMTKSKRKRTPKAVLKLPDFEQSKSAVLNSLTSPSSRRSYDHAIREI